MKTGLMHSDIKTYSFAETQSSNPDFALKNIADVFLHSGGTPDLPHRHDYYTILFIESGEGVHYIDFTQYQIQNNSIFFIMPGQMHQIIFSSQPQGWVITFTENFLISNSIPDKMINDIYLFNDYGQSPPLPVNDRDMPIYKSIVEQMSYFSASLESYTLEAVGALVKLFLIQSNNHCSLRKSNNPQFLETSNHLLRAFKQHLNAKYASLHMVSDYAGLLAVTADYLNKTVKNLTGKSAKEHIQSKLITEAKRSLLFSNISGKELAFELGFEESAHFNNFFKKITHMTPAEFRTFSRQS